MTEPKPLSDSDWSRLDEKSRDDHLRSLEALNRERFEALLDAQGRTRHRVSNLSMELKLQAEQVKRLVERMDRTDEKLDANTESTVRSEKKIDALSAATATMVSLFNDGAAAFRFFGHVGDGLKKLAWVLVPFSLIGAAWQATVLWVKTGGGPK